MKTKIIYILALLVSNLVSGQDLLDILEKEEARKTNYAEATFSFSRLAFGHSVQTRKKGVLDVFISNRFWDTGAEQSQNFMADRYSGRFGIDYGITDRLLVGAGYTNYDNRFDGFVKYNLVRQHKDSKGFPVTISVFQNMSYSNENLYAMYAGIDKRDKFAFTTQALIARKMSNKLSLQIAPTYIYRNFNYYNDTDNHHFALGFGGRYKLGKHVSLVSEYYYVANPVDSFDTYGPFSIGVNWEVSRVMVQLFLTNAVNMVEDAFILETRNNFNFRSPNLNFGFNFTYTFHLNNELKANKDK